MSTSASFGGEIAAAFSWRSCSRSMAREFRVALATHIRCADSDMWHRPGICGYCWHIVGPLPAEPEDVGTASTGARVPERPTAANSRRLSAPQEPQDTAPGGGLDVQCSVRVPQSLHR
ncbi:MAG TPA: hypothetical protein DEQ43_06425 [Nocardioides bacterium]|nr:hypothetical protein [Nocardioides sp.]